MRSSLACKSVGLLSAIRQGVDSDGSWQFVGDFRLRLRAYLQYSAVSVNGRKLGYVAVDLRLHRTPTSLQPCKLQSYKINTCEGMQSQNGFCLWPRFEVFRFVTGADLKSCRPDQQELYEQH